MDTPEPINTIQRNLRYGCLSGGNTQSVLRCQMSENMETSVGAKGLTVPTVLQTVTAMAQNERIDVERVERFLLMAERMQMREYESEFYDALSRVQSKIKQVVADSTNPSTHGSRYASYKAIDLELRPLRSDEGFSITFDTRETPIS